MVGSQNTDNLEEGGRWRVADSEVYLILLVLQNPTQRSVRTTLALPSSAFHAYPNPLPSPFRLIQRRVRLLLACLVGTSMARCSLAPGPYGGKWWGEAALTVTNVANRPPTQSETATPNQLFFGKRHVGHLRAIWCHLRAHVRHQVCRKMDDKTEVSKLMGFGEDTMGYKVLFIGRIVLSRDVRFNEELRGAESD